MEKAGQPSRGFMGRPPSAFGQRDTAFPGSSGRLPEPEPERRRPMRPIIVEGRVVYIKASAREPV
ncbi:MAG: hypothetical protein HGA90_07870 [Alphaproteobacteria bacterium]|nr:hypothetical protein [Alphaproteobacteria bacterium]